MDFPYKVAVITGASSGIGKGLALEFAKRGCHIGLIARRKGLLDEVAGQIMSMGSQALVIPCNVTEREALREAIARVQKELGDVDLLIANAGISLHISAKNFDLDRIAKTYEVNVLGAMNAIGAVLPRMIERGKGHIVGVSSLASYNGLPLKGSYCGSKAALRLELEALRIELAPKGIAVTTICPGFIETAMTAKNQFKLPLLLTVDKATRLMTKAIMKRKRIYEFPWRMAFAAKFGASIPRRLFDRAMQFSLPKLQKSDEGSI